MANKCDRCGVAKSYYKIVGADTYSNIRECYLCKNCYNDTAAQGWTSTKTGEVIRWQNSNGKCAFCGNIGNTREVPHTEADGSIKMYPACDNCKRQIDGGEESSNTKELKESDKTNWTKLMRGISIGFAIISTLSGGVLGAELGYFFDSAFFSVFGFLGGGFIGLAIGVVSIAFTMVICEISTTLKEILKEVKKK